MKNYTFKVFQKTDQLSCLRFLDQDNHILGERELASADIQRFVTEIG